MWRAALRQLVGTALAALAGLHGPALAHPHGVMACALSVHYENDRPVTLAARLVMDEAHSVQALTALRDPQSGQPETQRMQRMLFVLKTQMARANWLLGVESEGKPADFEAVGEPQLVLTDDGRVGVDVALRLQTDAAGSLGASWRFTCRDPGLYWTTELANTPASLKASGCARPQWSPALKVATGALAGSVQVDLQCLR
jgi:ABC-type uncharacterized transport system substrate-binding protein